MNINLRSDPLERDGQKTESQEAEILPPFGRNKEAKVTVITNVPHTPHHGYLLCLIFLLCNMIECLIKCILPILPTWAILNGGR